MSLTFFCSEQRDSDILIAVFVGFGDRLLGEVKQIAPKDIKIRVRCLLLCVWLYSGVLRSWKLL